jgi:Restriction endonuclease
MNTPHHEFEDIRSVEDLEVVSEAVIWQNFERLAAFIFEKNDFEVTVNTVKTWNKKRRQYDVISWKSDQTFLVECKKWSGSRYRLSALKKAIEQHKERTVFYENIMNEDAIPVVVTLVEEEIHWYEGVPIVPILKLNSFIGEVDTGATENTFDDFEDIPLVSDDVPTELLEYSGTDEEEF